MRTVTRFAHTLKRMVCSLITEVAVVNNGSEALIETLFDAEYISIN